MFFVLPQGQIIQLGRAASAALLRPPRTELVRTDKFDLSAFAAPASIPALFAVAAFIGQNLPIPLGGPL